MRKIVSALVLVMCFVSISFADGNPTAVNEYTYIINNKTGSAVTNLIPITIIRPGVDKITAYKVIPWDGGPGTGNAELKIAVFDNTTVNANSELIAEDEKSGVSAGERFDRPRKILNGIWVVQGANTTAIISFIRE
jgi:hypothetical protein